jgi:hypothetical protein
MTKRGQPKKPANEVKHTHSFRFSGTAWAQIKQDAENSESDTVQGYVDSVLIKLDKQN